MNDILSKARALSLQDEALASQLKDDINSLAKRVKEAIGKSDVPVFGGHVVLEECPEDEAVVGHLFYGGGTLSVAYRYTGDDRYDHAEDPSYSVKEIQDCSFKWLRALSQEASITSLLEKMLSGLEAQRLEAEAGLVTLANALRAPLKDATGALEAAALQLGYGDVVSMWSNAQASVITDPREAATRASSLVESVCRHILDTRGQPLPPKLTIQALFKETARYLDLSATQQLSDDLRKMSSGVATVVQALGELRTHAGTAHGVGPESPALTHAHARLAVNLSGAVSTFLLETLMTLKEPEDAV